VSQLDRVPEHDVEDGPAPSDGVCRRRRPVEPQREGVEHLAEPADVVECRDRRTVSLGPPGDADTKPDPAPATTSDKPPHSHDHEVRLEY
jgi:hypothetical protein